MTIPKAIRPEGGEKGTRRIHPARSKRPFGAWFQAAAMALAGNLLITLLLSLVALKQYDPGETVSLSVQSAPSPSRDSSPDSAAISNSIRKKAAPSPVSTSSQNVTTADSLSHFALSVTEFSTDTDLSGALLPLDTVSGGGIFGSGPGMPLGDSLRGRGITDGSNMILYLDVSGSMRKHSQQVSELIMRAFPRAKISKIKGCALKTGSGFVQELTWDSSDRTKVFFVCDLQDKQTPEGISRLRELLLIRKDPRELHILSFDRSPSFSLDGLIRESHGSVILMAKSSGKEPLRVRC